jgi:hypothetical protein
VSKADSGSEAHATEPGLLQQKWLTVLPFVATLSQQNSVILLSIQNPKKKKNQGLYLTPIN